MYFKCEFDSQNGKQTDDPVGPKPDACLIMLSHQRPTHRMNSKMTCKDVELVLLYLNFTTGSSDMCTLADP